MASVARRRSPRALLIGLIIFVLFGANFTAYFYTDVLWFQEVGLSSVLWKSLGTQWTVGLIVGVVVALLIWVNLAIAARSGPAYRRSRIQPAGAIDPLERYREILTPYTRLLRIGVAVLFGFLTGVVASAQWQTFLLFANRTRFGEADPQFGKDIGFYVFELPFYDLLADEVRGALMITLFASVAAHFFYGSIRAQEGLAGVSPGALAHISVLLGLLAVTRAVQYYLGQFQLNFSTRGVVDGASYTDVHAQLPALRILAIISVISALLFIVNIRFRRLALPLAAVGIWILFSVLAGGVWPWAVQRFSVAPQELPRERPYIERNLEATRQAFDLGDVETRPFAASGELAGKDLARNETLLQNVRLWDPGVLKLAYQQLQAIRTYYEFPDVDIDRYEVDDQTRQVLLSARELSIEELDDRSRNWTNEHLQYTHGFGIVASLANETTVAGQPSFLVRNVPGTVNPAAPALNIDQPRIYFGEQFSPADYSIVNSKQAEIDYPTEARPERSRYEGEGGVPVGSFGKRLAFAIREGDPNLILSGLITDESRIIFYRNVRDRVLRAAPFLSLDGDPYIANVEGRLVWILDAYTSTPFYPYSQHVDLGSITGEEEGTLTGAMNYVRNSVKVVVDAYDGTMDFYIVDPDDPLVQVWQDAFPSLFEDDEASSALQAHFRYPEDLFKVQSEVYLTYHMTQADDFYSKEDAWAVPRINEAVPETPTTSTVTVPSDLGVAPTYLLIQLPDEDDEEFVLTRPFTPRARNNMISFMVARSDPGQYGELLVLQFPRQRLVEGPAQVHNLINQDVEISRTLTLLGQRGSTVTFGSLITLPIEDSILYVQPLFVTADNLGIPELKRVILVFGEEVVMSETFDEGLAELFGTQPPPVQQPRPARGPREVEPEPGDDSELRALLEEASDVYDRAQAALADGDFEEYGRLIEELGELLEQAQRLR